MGITDILGLNNQMAGRAANVLPEYKPKGMFGVSGTFRDILGILGDSLLAGNGANPIFFPQNQAEKIGDAMRWQDIDPTLAASKVSSINPKLGQDMLEANQRSVNDRLTREQAQRNADRTFTFNEGKEKYDRFKDIAPGLFGLINSADAKSYPGIRAKALAISEKYGQPLPLDLPEKFDPSVTKQYSTFAIPPYQQANLEAQQSYREALLGQNAERIGISRQGANTSEYTAYKPKKVSSYVGVDGKQHTVFDDGSEIVSETEVRPTGGRRGRPSGTSAPAATTNGPPPPRKVGDKIRGPNGEILTSKDGKTWSK